MPSPALAAALASLALSAGGTPGPPAAGAPDAPAPARTALRASLERVVAAGTLATARVGVLVKSLDTGEVLFAHDPDALLNPASNVKLFTSAAALARLGPDFRFETEFRLAPRPAGAPDLHVRGKGDPTLVHERLWAIAGELAHAGVARVHDLVLDESWFDGEREGPGYDQERGDRAYLAPTGALSLDFNAVAVHVAPGEREGAPARVSLEPATDFFAVENRAITTAAGTRRRVAISSGPAAGRQRIAVEGRVPAGSRPQVVYRKVDDPPRFLGATLRRYLELRGVRVAGKVRPGPAPEGARLVHVAESEPLGDVVRRLNKHSNNFVAEQILKALGAEAQGPPGTWPKGIAAVEAFLAEAGLPRGSYLMKNGSGLNDANRFSARQTVALLELMWRRFPLAPEFVGALPVAARDGTIRWRLEGTDAAGRLRAKTGTLTGVSALSGYAESRGGERLAFAIVVNDHPGRTADAVRAVDAMAAAVAAGGLPGEPGAARGEALAAAPDAGAAGDAEVRVAAYYRLGLAGDPRNLPFLRTALRTEGDPAARTAVAEAVYLSDPYGEGARRAFVEAAGDAAAVERLRTLAGGLVASPVIGSLADLAAEGVAEALTRLAELSAAGMGERLAPTWAEVAALAPAETAALLLGAPRPLAEAVAASLAAGLALAPEPAGRHPLAVELDRAGEAGGEAGDAARALAASLREHVEAARGAAAGRGGPAGVETASGAGVPPRGPAASRPDSVAPAAPAGVELGTRPGGG
jgi:D-alanyl-D-alanine carboxypeptidase/D-alanyl-D-alanine-endopeptidase (penicillin-binding protein 4)